MPLDSNLVPLSSQLQQREIPDDIRAFCMSNNVLNELCLAIGLLKKHFPESEIRVQLKEDHEEDGQWVVVKANVNSERKDAFLKHREFLRDWVQYPITPLIRPSYSLA